MFFRMNARPTRAQQEAQEYQQVLGWLSPYLEVAPTTVAVLARHARRHPEAPFVKVVYEDLGDFGYVGGDEGEDMFGVAPGYRSKQSVRARTEAELAGDIVDFLMEACETGDVIMTPPGADPMQARWSLRPRPAVARRPTSGPRLTTPK